MTYTRLLGSHLIPDQHSLINPNPNPNHHVTTGQTSSPQRVKPDLSEPHSDNLSARTCMNELGYHFMKSNMTKHEHLTLTES